MMKTKIVEFLMVHYKQHKQRVCNTSLEHCIQVAEAMRTKAKYCFIISNGSNGWCSTRLVEPIFTKEDEGSKNLQYGYQLVLIAER